MNHSARLFYHLQEKEEELLQQSRKLEASEHTFQMEKREQEAMLRLAKERMENTYILYQTKLENLNHLMTLKEEGYKQQLEYAHHQSEIKELLHRDEMHNLSHKAEIKDLINADKIDRLQDFYQNEKVLENIDHHRELLSLDETIAAKMHEIHSMKSELQHWQELGAMKDQKMSILKEQGILESKSRQLAENTMKQQSQFMEWKEDYLKSLEVYKQKEIELKEKSIDIYYRDANQKINSRESKLDLKQMQNESYSDYLNAKEERIQSEYNKMEADYTARESDLFNRLKEREIEFGYKHLKRRNEAFKTHKSVWKESQKADRERYNFYRNYSDSAQEYEELKRNVQYEQEHLEDLKAEQQQVYYNKMRIEAEKRALEKKVEEIKQGLPSGKENAKGNK